MMQMYEYVINLIDFILVIFKLNKDTYKILFRLILLLLDPLLFILILL